MPATLKRIRETMSRTVKQTPRNKGLKLTITVDAYDNGLIDVDGIPMESPETGWTDAAEVIAITLNEFHRQVLARRKKLAPRA